MNSALEFLFYWFFVCGFLPLWVAVGLYQFDCLLVEIKERKRNARD